MAARSTMAWIIGHVRLLANDVDSAVWDDEEVQVFLDQHRMRIRRSLLTSEPDEMQYHSKYALLEGDADTWSGSGSETDVINIWDSRSSDATDATPDSWNLVDGTFAFTSDQDDTYYLDAWSYNIYRAIADMMLQLAGDRSKAHVWIRGGVSHTVTDFFTLSKEWRSLGGPKSTVIKKTYRSEQR